DGAVGAGARADRRGLELRVAGADLAVGVLAPAPEGAARVDGAGVVAAGGDREPRGSGTDLRGRVAVRLVPEPELALLAVSPAPERAVRPDTAGLHQADRRGGPRAGERGRRVVRRRVAEAELPRRVEAPAGQGVVLAQRAVVLRPRDRLRPGGPRGH